MSNVELILRLVEVKAGHYSGSSFTYAQAFGEENFEGTTSALAREEIYDAKSEALMEIVDEIRQCIISTASEARADGAGSPDQRWAFITEMAGTMTASIKNTYDEIKDARDRFDRDHADYFEENGNAKCAYNLVIINPRRRIPNNNALSTGVLDVRLVLITDLDGELTAIICDTEADLKRQIEEFEEEYRYEIKSRAAVWSSHEVMIPPKAVVVA